VGASWHCHRSADWQSAVSRIGNPPTCRIPFGETADCQSALRACLEPYRWQCQDALSKVKPLPSDRVVLHIVLHCNFVNCAGPVNANQTAWSQTLEVRL